ncbi:MAG: hypothetical protein HKN62_10345 [Phycisphaerales bacterium]|nr:hypothetical protein [Phycisphaerales bacterium]
MATVSYNGQCFNLDGRRLWLLAAGLHYTRIPREAWTDRIAAARQAGFNTVDVGCPWMQHEPRRGRYQFDGANDVKAFIECCGAAGMRVILRPGPFIGDGFDGGGIPPWLGEDESVRLREANEVFLERVSKYFRKLLAEVADLQATRGGPIVIVQVEHGWTCANDAQAERYLREIARVMREGGINVPLTNANNLWLESADTIDTWRGDDDLLVNLRQLRAVQPDAPRLVRAFEQIGVATWGTRAPEGLEAATMLRRTAEILAAGAQPIIAPFHGGTNFGFLAGRPLGASTGCTTTAAAGAPLGEAGSRGARYHQLRRLVTCADQFAHVFFDLDPDYHPVAIDPGDAPAKGGGRKSRRGSGIALVPLRGPGGRIIFAFGDGATKRTTLLLDNGVRLPIDLGDQPVGWYVVDVDLHGQGTLDYANLCPFALVDRAIVVLFGPERADGIISVNGTPRGLTVPGGAKPLVIEHRGILFVICNQTQIETTYHDESAVYVGIDGFDAEGVPRPAGAGKAWRVTRADGLESLSPGGVPAPSGGRSVALGAWEGASAATYADGSSPRFASLPGPQSLVACGALSGYGWYRVQLKSTSPRARLVHFAGAADRRHLYLDGKAAGVVGPGPGATPNPVNLKLAKGTHTLSVLVDNIGRLADGDAGTVRSGLWDDVVELKRLTGVRPKTVTAEPIDPFALKGFVFGAAAGRPSDATQVAWSFTHARKTRLLIDVQDLVVPGTFVLNDVPIASFAGESGATTIGIPIDGPRAEPLKRGKNTLRFAPTATDAAGVKAAAAAVTIYECVEVLSQKGGWAFAKWEPPTAASFAPVAANASLKGAPAWWRTSCKPLAADRIWWFDTAGLSKGQIFVNGHNVGRYFTTTATGRAAGPQTRLFLPADWLRADKPNELVVFDEHGFSPHKTKVVARPGGELD